MFSICVGICVYNEENNIRNILASLLAQKTTNPIKEIIVVSSACTDRTDAIIENEFLTFSPKIILLKQEKREGKASAINLILKSTSSDIVVLESGDTTPTKGTIVNLTKHFENANIGMTGGHPIPVNNPDTFMGFTVHLLWNLHHKLAKKNPKLGELVAFRRNLVDNILNDTAVDEAFIEALIKRKGFELKYVPDAIVYNKGPENISDFLKQRRRIYAGHKSLKKTDGYAPSSMNILSIVRVFFEDLDLGPKESIWALGSIFLELYGRLLGLYDFYIKKDNPFIWNIAQTTKSNIPTPATVNYASPNISKTKPVNTFRQVLKTQQKPEANFPQKPFYPTVLTPQISLQHPVSYSFDIQNYTIKTNEKNFEHIHEAVESISGEHDREIGLDNKSNLFSNCKKNE